MTDPQKPEISTILGSYEEHAARMRAMFEQIFKKFEETDGFPTKTNPQNKPDGKISREEFFAYADANLSPEDRKEMESDPKLQKAFSKGDISLAELRKEFDTKITHGAMQDSYRKFSKADLEFTPKELLESLQKNPELIKNLPAEKIEALKKDILQLDADNSGKISLPELISGLQKFMQSTDQAVPTPNFKGTPLQTPLL